MTTREVWLNTRWNDKDELVCGCLFNAPLCNRHRECEFIRAKYNPFDDIEQVMKGARTYKKVKGRIREVK